MLDFTVPWWLFVAGGIALLVMLIWAISSGVNDPELEAILETPARDMTVGHVVVLVVLAGLFFGR